jgi:hypothetical protein
MEMDPMELDRFMYSHLEKLAHCHVYIVKRVMVRDGEPPKD